jgi:chromosome segregation protein
LGDNQAGVLLRERELKTLKLDQARAAERIAGLEREHHAKEHAVREAEREHEGLQAEERRLNAEHGKARSEFSAARARCEQSAKRLRQIQDELADVDALDAEQREDLESARELRLEAEERLAELEREAAGHADDRDRLEARLAEAEAALRQGRERVNTLNGRAESLRAGEQLTRRHLERAKGQYEQARQRLAALQTRAEAIDQPTGATQEELDALTDRRAQVERQLKESRRQAEERETALRRSSEARQRNEMELDGVKQRLEQIRLDLSANEVRRQTVREQFEELDVTPEQVVTGLPDEADENRWQQRVAELAEDIARLGAVNLTAMEECRAQEERMAFLDQQHGDLSESLATLREAIEKIDRECRSRFKDTFDLINTGLQRMFPKLFGGGQASLELTERDLLETGVTVMARPPGKRNSSIHLLSGGEKALTAAALVFAIFELNPAPFCLLDEVDAPLDDANVGRFSQLVKEMSERVQFLFISHNKVTMEIAQHLAGVTMKEPGVSRIVAVDIEAAVELAAA